MQNQQLIPVFQGHISGETVQLVDARTLHAFLESKQDFSTWIKKRIAAYGFIENKDYIQILGMEGFPQNSGKLNGGRPTLEYHLTLDMSKELSMVERNAKGKEARLYFIECEKKLHQANPIPVAMSNPFDGIDAALLRQLGRIGNGLPWAYLISKGVTPELVLNLLTANRTTNPVQTDLFMGAA